MTRSDDEIDELLRTHVSGALDGQRGRALAAFEATAAAPIAPPASPGRARGRRLGLFAAGGALIAASILVALSVRAPRPRHDPLNPAPAPVAIASVDPAYESLLTWAAIDEGPSTIDDATPARRVRYETVEQIEWADPEAGATIQLSIPREHVVFVPEMPF